MPKIRCRHCEAVLNIPDKAAGKTVACPKCQNKLKVPAAKSADAPAPKKKKKVQAEVDDDPFGFGKIDDYALEDTDDQICPYCAAALGEDDPVCRSCGMNVETGQMDRREAKIRARKGPDPGLFYKGIWADSWAFLKKEWGLAIRTGTAWTLFSVLTMMCGYMGFIYIQDQMPPKVFWCFMTFLMGLGIPGWYWILGLKIVETSRLKQKFQADRIHFEFFTSIASGIRSIFWPAIMMGPVTPILVIVWALLFMANPFDPVFGALIGVCIGLLPLIMLPLAMVHMTARHSYKGWIFWELLKDLFRNFVAVVYYHIVSLIVVLPAVLVAVPIFLLIQDVNPFNSTVVNNTTASITMGTINTLGMNADADSWMFTALRVPLNIGAAFLLFAPIAYTAAFPAVFLMRANGAFGYYNQETIDTVDRIRPGVPATFWIRYLSHTVDWLLTPLTCFIVTSNRRASTVCWLGLGVVLLLGFFTGWDQAVKVLFLWLLYCSWMYWVVQESSQLQSTIGKDTFGLIVVTEDDKTLSLSQANTKWFLRIIFDLFTGLPFLMAAVDPKKRTLHDVITKTKVVWKGDR